MDEKEKVVESKEGLEKEEVGVKESKEGHDINSLGKEISSKEKEKQYQDSGVNFHVKREVSWKIFNVDYETATAFKRYTDDECGKLQSVALKRLMEIKAEHEIFMTVYNNVFSQVNDLNERLDHIESALTPKTETPTAPTSDRPLTFGQKKKLRREQKEHEQEAAK